MNLVIADFHNTTRPTVKYEQILSDETAILILKVLMYGVIPCVNATGIVWNIISIIILKKHGLKKCSNILLVSLAFTDTSYLIAFNNVPNILYELQGNGRFLYTETVSYVLYAVYFVFHYIDYVMGLSSLTLPMLITVERVVAVFLPLSFSRIITPARTWAAVGSVISYWIVYIAYTCFWYQFEYIYDETMNRSVGILGRSKLFYKDQHLMATLEEINFSMKVPPLFTLFGCIMIIIKVKIMSIKRKKMTNKVRSTSKTTKMLLAVCLFYTFACICGALPTYLPKEWTTYSVTAEEPSNLGNIMYLILNLISCVNASWNFLVYVGFNKNFRDTLKEITIHRCIKNPEQQNHENKNES